MTGGSKKINTVLFNGVAVGEVEVTGDARRDAEAARNVLRAKGLYAPISQETVMFRQALSFANTSAHLYKNGLSKNPLNIAPFVVNAAFGIELYLKTIAHKYGQTLTGHNLLKLFDALPAAAQAAIEIFVPPCAKERGIELPINVRECVSDLSNAFVEWRYLHEKDPSQEVHIPKTIFVMQCLHEACRAIEET